MKRALVSLTISICISLVLATTFLILTPFTTFADSCTASCPGGRTVTCQADSKGFCAASDGIGCSGAQIKGCDGEEL